MSNASEFVEKLYGGDEVAAAAALAELTDPHRVADEVRRQMETRRVLDDFVAANQDLVGDPRLAGVADMHLDDVTHGRSLDDMAPEEARRALANAGQRTRDWLRRVVPRAASEQREQAEPSAIIAQMRKARGQF
jgi:hypothetical protein